MKTMKFKKALAIFLCMTMPFAFAITASAADNQSIEVSDSSVETSQLDSTADSRAFTQIANVSGSLAPGQSITYSFSIDRRRDVKIYASGGNVSDMNGGGRLWILAGAYNFNNYTGLLDTLPLPAGTYQYRVENTSNDTITYAVLIGY